MIRNSTSLGIKSIRFFVVVLAMISTMACKHTNIQSSDEGIVVNVVKSSGDDFSYNINDSTFSFLPYPFNLGTSSEDPSLEEVVILSKQLNPGSQVRIQTFGKMHISTVDGNKTEVVLAYPVDASKRLFNIRDLYDFSSRHFAVKHLIEYWYLNRYGLNGASVESWEPYILSTYTE